VDTGLNKNKTELGVLVLAVLLEVLAHGDSLLDEEVKILRKSRSKTLSLEDTEDLRTSDSLDLGNAMRVTKDGTDLGREDTLTSELNNLVLDRLRSSLLVVDVVADIGKGGTGDTLSRSVHATHG